MKQFLLLVLCISSISAVFAQIAPVQIIHNSPAAATELVHLYINKILWVGNFAIRRPAPFLNIPLENGLLIGSKTVVKSNTSQKLTFKSLSRHRAFFMAEMFSITYID